MMTSPSTAADTVVATPGLIKQVGTLHGQHYEYVLCANMSASPVVFTWFLCSQWSFGHSGYASLHKWLPASMALAAGAGWLLSYDLVPRLCSPAEGNATLV